MNECLTRRELVGTSVLAAASVAAASRLVRADRPIPPELLAKAERKFQLGLVTYNIARDWDVPTIVTRCKQAGYAAVELRTTHEHRVEPTLDKAQRQAVKKLFADSPVVLWSLGTTCEFHSPDPAVVTKNIDEAKRFIELAVDVGAKAIKVRPNGLPKEVAVDKTIEQIGRALRTVGEAAQPAGIKVCCEMHGSGTQEPAIMRRIMEAANHPAVGVTWNCNPTDIKVGSVRQSFDLMYKWIFNVHINELISSYPYREFFTLLRGIGYAGYTMMEIQGLASKDDFDMMRFMAYYKALWSELSRPT